MDVDERFGREGREPEKAHCCANRTLAGKRDCESQIGSSRSNAGVSGPPRRLNLFCGQANLVGFTAAHSPVFESADLCAVAQTLDRGGAMQELAADLRPGAPRTGSKAASPG